MYIRVYIYIYIYIPSSSTVKLSTVTILDYLYLSFLHIDFWDATAVQAFVLLKLCGISQHDIEPLSPEICTRTVKTS
jgi:hypothetical protein